MRPLRAWMAGRRAVVRWCTVRVVVAGVFLAQAVSRWLLVGLLAMAALSMFTRHFGTAASASAAVVGGVWVWRSNCTARRGAARWSRAMGDWRRGRSRRWWSCVVVLLATATSVVLRS
jgi:hypothetical protein